EDVVRKHCGRFLEKFHATCDVAGHLVDVVAIGRHAPFRFRDLGFALEQRKPGRFGPVLAECHHAHRHAPATDDGDRETSRSDLHPRADGDEPDLALRTHEEFAFRKPAPQAGANSANGYRFQMRPRLTRPKALIWRVALARAWCRITT